MNRSIIFVGIVGFAIGAAIGTNASRYFARQHEKTTAVMVLLSLHQQQWEAAVARKDCAVATNELSSLQWLAREIAVVLPLANQQDAVFHGHVQKMSEVLSTTAADRCAGDVDTIKQIRETCDECHREYR